MRKALIALAAAALGWSASAQDASDPGVSRYFSSISSLCPNKLLQYLSPTDLRDGLDDYMSGLPQDQQDQMRRAERSRCASTSEGVACVNSADIETVDGLGLTDQLALSMCQSFLRCRAQSDCDHAR